MAHHRNLRPALVAGLVGCLLASVAALGATPAPVGTLPFINGGITKDEADLLRQEAPRYPLEITLARRGETPGRNEFVAEGRLRVVDSAGRVVVERSDAGPIFLASLPDGVYTVEVSYNGLTKTERVQLSSGRHVQVTFLWE
jgi:hypothetical protein